MGQEYLRSSIVAGNAQAGKGLILYEDFEGTLAWDKSGTGGDDVLELATDNMFIGKQALHMKTRTTGASAADTIIAERSIPVSPNGILAYNCLFKLPDVSDNQRINFSIYYYDGAAQWYTSMKITPGSPKVEYLNDAGAYQQISEFAFGINDGKWNSVEIVIDYFNQLLVSMCFCDKKKIFTDVSLRNAGAVTTLMGLLTVNVDAAGATPAEAYLDQLLVREVFE